MLHYGSYMNGSRLEWRCLLVLFILFCFDLRKELGINQNPKKCAFMVFLGIILGFIVSKEGKKLDFKKIEGISF